jgi:hypothetical protein
MPSGREMNFFGLCSLSDLRGGEIGALSKEMGRLAHLGSSSFGGHKRSRQDSNVRPRFEIASPHFTPVVARVVRPSASVNPRACARAVTGVVPNAISFAEAVEP